MRKNSIWMTLLALNLTVICPAAMGQWVTQTIELESGWNAVFLEIEPYPRTCDRQFEGLPIESVWSCNQRFSSVQFVQDPDDLVPDNPEWQSYFPPDRPESVATNLHILDPGRAYMIKATAPATWTLKGKPRLTEQEWNPNTYNLVGFYVDPEDPPTLSEWFAGSAAHSPLDVWDFGGDQQWHPVNNPGSTAIQPGKAYWVRCQEASDFQGPVRITLRGGWFLEFPSFAVKSEMTFESEGAVDRDVSLSLQPSETPPAVLPNEPEPDIPPLAGEVPLTYYGFGIVGAVFDYLDFPMTLGLSNSEGLVRELEVAVERDRMVTAPADALYQSIMVVEDGQGYRRLVGVTSEGRMSRTTAKRRREKGLLLDIPPEVGLWSGTVSLDKVSEPNVLNANPAPVLLTSTQAEFIFPILLHVSEASEIRLLNEVTQLFREETVTANPYNPSEVITVEPGRVVLMTANPPQELLDDIADEEVVPITLRDGRRFANRISTAMFSLRDANGEPETPLMIPTGSFYADGSALSVTLVLENTDPLNPFHHQFHPMHGYPEEGDTVLPPMDYTITRQIVMTFSADPPDGVPRTGWGDSLVGGTYAETILGLRKVNQTTPPVITQGTFTLQRISTVGVLNDGL